MNSTTKHRPVNKQSTDRIGVSKKLDREPEFMKAGRQAEGDPLRDLALYLNHRIVLTPGQRRRARARATRLIAERRATRAADLERKK